jgi:hypothetical protein
MTETSTRNIGKILGVQRDRCIGYAVAEIVEYATSRKVACSSPDEIIDTFQFIYSFYKHCGPGV